MVRLKLNSTRLEICCWFLCVSIVLSMAGVVSWLSLCPRNPRFKFVGGQFPVQDSKNHLNGSLPNHSSIFNLQIFNPNKHMGIYYNGISLELYGGGALVGTNSTPAFHQGYKDTSVVQIVIQQRQDFRTTADMDFVCRVETGVKFRIIKWKTKVHQIVYLQSPKINLNGTVSEWNDTN